MVFGKLKGESLMKKALASLLIVFLIFGVLGCTSKSTTVLTTKATPAVTTAGTTTPTLAGEPIKIGLTTVLTGDRAAEGEFASNAVKMAVKKINGSGGVLGRPIEVVIQDAQGTDVGAVNAYRKIADDPKIVAIIGSDNSNDNIAISASVLQAKILTTAQGSNPKLAALCIDGNPWMFQLRAVQETMLKAMLEYAIKDLGLKKFVIINDTETNSADQALISQRVLTANNIKPLDVISFTTGTKDFSSHIAKIQLASPDAIIGTCLHTEAALLTQQIRAMGIKLPIFGSSGFSDQMTIDVAGDAMNGVYSATAYVPDVPAASNPNGAAFAKEYFETFGKVTANPAAQVYDHIFVICEAIKKAGTTDRTAVRDAMLKVVDFKGVITTYDCSKRGSCASGALLVQVQNRKPVVLQQIFTK
jgi:branched-chain amino acid transport system substrate-binding protein